MAVINSDVFCSFRFKEFENGSHYTVFTAVHKTSLQYNCTQNQITVTSLQHRCTQYSFQ